jgi:hypothetical protein
MSNLPNDRLSSSSDSNVLNSLDTHLQFPVASDSFSSSSSLPSLSTHTHSELDSSSAALANDPDIVNTTVDETTAARALNPNSESDSEQIGQRLLNTSFSPSREPLNTGSQTSFQSNLPGLSATTMATSVTTRKIARPSTSARRGNTISALISAQEQLQAAATGSSSATNLSTTSDPVRRRVSARMSARVASDTTGSASTSQTPQPASTSSLPEGSMASPTEQTSSSRPASPPQIVILDGDSPTQSTLIDLTKDSDDCLIISHRQGNKRRMMPPPVSALPILGKFTYLSKSVVVSNNLNMSQKSRE